MGTDMMPPPDSERVRALKDVLLELCKDETDLTDANAAIDIVEHMLEVTVVSERLVDVIFGDPGSARHQEPREKVPEGWEYWNW
jgi:hypothetical protein